jgi:hypothetical protein
MFHNGQTHLKNQTHFGKIAHDDEIIIQLGSNLGANCPRDLLTTHQANFVKHPLEVRRALTPEGPRAKGPPFDGKSSYLIDYVEHPINLNERSKPEASHWKPSDLPPTVRSTYRENFPWHDASPEMSKKRQVEYVPVAPFHGQSSYKQDYIKHPLRALSDSRPPGDRKINQDVPFDASTTYFRDFQKHPFVGNTPRQEGRKREFPSPPFAGKSEYKIEYLEKQLAKATRLHLMPERRSSAGSQASRNGSRGFRATR